MASKPERKGKKRWLVALIAAVTVGVPVVLGPEHIASRLVAVLGPLLGGE